MFHRLVTGIRQRQAALQTAATAADDETQMQMQSAMLQLHQHQHQHHQQLRRLPELRLEEEESDDDEDKDENEHERVLVGNVVVGNQVSPDRSNGADTDEAAAASRRYLRNVLFRASGLGDDDGDDADADAAEDWSIGGFEVDADEYDRQEPQLPRQQEQFRHPQPQPLPQHYPYHSQRYVIDGEDCHDGFVACASVHAPMPTPHQSYFLGMQSLPVRVENDEEENEEEDMDGEIFCLDM